MSEEGSDVPPLPTEGDSDQDTTFAAVGYALNCWEGLEVELCGLFAAFKGWRRASTEAIVAYSQPRIFVERLAVLRDAFERWAVATPDQKQEGEIKAILCRASDLSAVRNNIAHGVIAPFDRKPKPLGVLVEPPREEMFT